jgi:RNA 3'-terminal phosphate cyclase (ATP)
MLVIDGSAGEGGGQILRTSLSLSLVTGQPFVIEKIRAGREKPGLRAQHLAAVKAAAAIAAAVTKGAEVGSQRLRFEPARVCPGDYAFAVGTAGSATLVLQTILPGLMRAATPSTLVLEGGTHNPLAPPFEFLVKTFLPLVVRMGPRVRVKLDRHGFFPVGGGKLRVTIEPAAQLSALNLSERGHLVELRATALISNLPGHVAERELKVLKRDLDLEPRALRVEEVRSPSPANVLMVEAEFAHLTEVLSTHGEKGLKAEVVAGRLAHAVRAYLEAGAPVGEHLADQLLLPLALAGCGSFVTAALSPHAQTNLAVIQRFLPVRVVVAPESDRTQRVTVTAA